MKTRLLALGAAITLAAGVLSGCSSESAEHKEAVEQYQAAWDAYEQAYEAVEADIEYCKTNMWNCHSNSLHTNGGAFSRDVSSGVFNSEHPEVKELAGYGIDNVRNNFEIEKSGYDSAKITEVTLKRVTESGLEEEKTYTLPLSDNVLNEDDGLTIEQLMEVKNEIEKEASKLESNEWKTRAQNSLEYLRKQANNYVKDCTARKESGYPWTDEHERGCKVAWEYDENKEYTIEELVNHLEKVWGMENVYTQGAS